MSSFDSSFAPPPPPLIPTDSKFTSIQANKTKVTKGTVTQLLTTSTGVTLNADAGVITCVASTLASNAAEAFLVTNANVSATSVVIANVVMYTGTQATAAISVFVNFTGEGSFNVVVANGSGAVLDGIVTVGFMVV